MASEIMGLPDQRGFLKSGNLVVRLSFPYTDLPKIQPAFVERNIDWQRTDEPSARQQCVRNRATRQRRARSEAHPQRAKASAGTNQATARPRAGPFLPVGQL